MTSLAMATSSLLEDKYVTTAILALSRGEEEGSHEIFIRHGLSSSLERTADFLQKENVETGGRVRGSEDVQVARLSREHTVRIPRQDRPLAQIDRCAEVPVTSGNHQPLDRLQVAIDTSFPGEAMTTLLRRHFDDKRRHAVCTCIQAWMQEFDGIHGRPLDELVFKSGFDVILHGVGITPAYARLQTPVQFNLEMDGAHGADALREWRGWLVGLLQRMYDLRCKSGFSLKIDRYRSTVVVFSEAMDAKGHDVIKTLQRQETFNPTSCKPLWLYSLARAVVLIRAEALGRASPSGGTSAKTRSRSARASCPASAKIRRSAGLGMLRKGDR